MTPPAPSSPLPGPAAVEQIARRFPIVPRPQPVLLPLGQQLAEIAGLARTPPEHPDAPTRIAFAHNKAALIASNCGHPDLARALCLHHHDRYLHGRPWNAADARRALEPMVNIARLRIRDGNPDAAIESLASLLAAVTRGGIADVDGHPVDLGDAFATVDDRATIRRWIWTVTLAEGIRGLARAGRFDYALDHAHRHHGVGATLLDGRQIAVLAHAFRGNHDTGAALLSDTITAEPWQNAVAHILGLVIHRNARSSVPPRSASPHVWTLLRTGDGLFAWEVLLAGAELEADEERSNALAKLERLAEVSTNAAFARAVLTHPARHRLPHAVLDHLAAVRNLAIPTITADRLNDAVLAALAGGGPELCAAPSRPAPIASGAPIH